MAYNRNNNNNNGGNNNGGNRINTTSYGPQFYNTNTEEDNSTLVLSLWNKSAIIKIHPELAQKGKNGQTFDYDSELSIVINLKNLYNIKKGLSLLLSPKNTKYQSIAVDSTGKDGIKKRLMISKGIFTDDDQVVLSIFTLDDNGAAESVYNYFFNFKTDADDGLIVNFDPETGSSKKLWVNSEITIFIDWITDACEALRNASSHGVNITLKQTEAKLETKIEGNGGGSSSRSTSGGGKKFGNYKKTRNLGISRDELADDEEVSYEDDIDIQDAGEEMVDDIADLEDMLED